LCDHRPWPFEDRFFDFATCSHLLEDVRDPIWICHELCRVAKAGYIEVPSRIVEQSLGVEHPRFAGFHHHRWLINLANDTLEFRHKPHLLHSVNDAIVARVGINRVINPKYEVLVFHWNQSFNYREILEFDEKTVVRELCEFARTARAIPDLTVLSDRSCWERFKRWIYYCRLRRGRR
jgi:ubiquinone/menaquinone biosynthesis C-methylase UbiE